MGRLCQDCQKREATMHLTDIKDSKKTEQHLCKQCAQKLSAWDFFHDHMT